jgi:hypothetical protein
MEALEVEVEQGAVFHLFIYLILNIQPILKPTLLLEIISLSPSLVLEASKLRKN